MRLILTTLLFLCSTFVNAGTFTYSYEGEIKRVTNDLTGNAIGVGSKVSGLVTYNDDFLLEYIYAGVDSHLNYSYNKINFTMNIDGFYEVDINDVMSTTLWNDKVHPGYDAGNTDDQALIKSNLGYHDQAYIDTFQKINGQSFLNVTFHLLDRDGLALQGSGFEKPIFGDVDQYEKRVMQFFIGHFNEKDMSLSQWGTYTTNINSFKLVP